MVKALVPFDVACNDPDNGDFAGRAWMATFGAYSAELEAPFGREVKFTETDRGFRFLRHEFAVRRTVHWYGNWCWNRYWLTRAEAKRLLGILRAKGWRCTCGPDRFYRWMNGAAA